MANENNERCTKYSDFITEQSNDISLDFVCYAQKEINRVESINEIDKYTNDIRAAMEIEAGIFEYSLLYIQTNNLAHKLISSIYNYKINDIIKNIKINSELLSDFKNNRIKPRMAAFMSPSQLYPKKWEVLLAKKQLKEEKEHNLPTTDIYKCRKCGERKTNVSFLQTRSIDEPMTIFINCCNCYNTWTI